MLVKFVKASCACRPSSRRNPQRFYSTGVGIPALHERFEFNYSPTRWCIPRLAFLDDRMRLGTDEKKVTPLPLETTGSCASAPSSAPCHFRSSPGSAVSALQAQVRNPGCVRSPQGPGDNRAMLCRRMHDRTTEYK